MFQLYFMCYAVEDAKKTQKKNEIIAKIQKQVKETTEYFDKYVKTFQFETQIDHNTNG